MSLLVVTLLTFSSCAPESISPNLILISVDTLRADYLGAFGDPDGYASTLDRLAAFGGQFEKTIVSIPHTTPSHATMLTGLHPMNHKSRDNGFPIADNITTFPQNLGRNGYDCAGFAAHFLLSAECSGLDRGFRIFETPARPAYFDLPQENPGIFPLHSNQSLTADQVNRNALKWIETASSPFFMFIHYYDCHRPHIAPALFDRFNSPTVYQQEIAYVDRAIYAVLTALSRRGQLSNAIVHIVADHGESLGEHNYTGHGRQLYFPSLEVPWIFRDFRVEKYRRIITQNARSVDIMPTLSHQLQIPVPYILDGVNLFAESSGATWMFSESATGWNREKGKRIRSVRSSDHTYIYGPASGIEKLFNREQDPGELWDISAEAPGIRDNMREAVKSWISLDQQTIENPADVLDPALIDSLRALGYMDVQVQQKLEKPSNSMRLMQQK